MDRLLDAAGVCFVEQGYAATSRIAYRTGVSMGSLDQFFPDGAALLPALQGCWTGDWRASSPCGSRI